MDKAERDKKIRGIISDLAVGRYALSESLTNLCRVLLEGDEPNKTTEEQMLQYLRSDTRYLPTPPDGMAIQVWDSWVGNWVAAVSCGGGKFSWEYRGKSRPLSDRKWRYWPAPKRWPEGRQAWLATDTGEYVFSNTSNWNLGIQSAHGRIIHMEVRPEEEKDA